VAGREFPSSAAQLNGDEWSRRSFLKLMGASVALAGFGVSSCRRPELHLVPFTKTVEWTIPGKFLYYSTRCRDETGQFRSWLRPLTAGQSSSTAIRCIRQATVQRCVRAGRQLTSFTTRCEQSALPIMAKPPTPPRFEKYLGDLRTKIGDGAGLAFWLKKRTRPRAKEFAGELEKNVPTYALVRFTIPCAAKRKISPPRSVSAIIYASFLGLSAPMLILALDSDFLDCGEGDIASSRAFSFRRRVSSGKDSNEPALCR